MSTVKKELSRREMLFCGYYAELASPQEAAVRAGYKTRPESTAIRLLMRDDIQAEILRQRTRKSYTEAALAGIARLALGSANDAARLACAEGELSPGELAALDLFAVSEIKKMKGGGCEVRLHDRQKALALLLEYTSGTNGGVNPLLEALDRGARAAQPPGSHAD